MKQLITLFFMVAISTVFAQITSIGTVDKGLQPLFTLESAGYKLSQVDLTTSTINLYNEDLTPYQTISIPIDNAVVQRGVYYISDMLFDTDPTTIEYLVLSTDTAQPYAGRIQILQEDGNVLFELNPATLGEGNPGAQSGATDAIYNTPNGTYMILYQYGFVSNSMLFSLPGHLPCVDCHGDIVNAIPGVDRMDLPTITLYPNPADGNVTLEMGKNGSDQARTVLVTSVDGSIVLTQAVARAQERVVLDTRSLANGNYVVNVQPIGRAAKLVVAR